MGGMTLLTGRFREQTDSCKATEVTLERGSSSELELCRAIPHCCWRVLTCLSLHITHSLMDGIRGRSLEMIWGSGDPLPFVLWWLSLPLVEGDRATQALGALTPNASTFILLSSCDIYCRAGRRLKGLFIIVREMPRSWSLAVCKDQQPAPQLHGEMQSLEKEEEEEESSWNGWVGIKCHCLSALSRQQSFPWLCPHHKGTVGWSPAASWFIGGVSTEEGGALRAVTFEPAEGMELWESTSLTWEMQRRLCVAEEVVTALPCLSPVPRSS
ncbi:hypothetical protein IHE44_0002084 [Lamprotornis superbus]|uniref:Uncharacterized protein n=1 Tax=Lamprotornis superbus TaxID=245042 RepID=A0A835NUD3_9PASS|nr:hypothetical protein IHE44_0002084 [Lamprotornis superbus]